MKIMAMNEILLFSTTLTQARIHFPIIENNAVMTILSLCVFVKRDFSATERKVKHEMRKRRLLY